MKIAIATDHNGVNEKKEIMNLIKDVEFVDYSPNNYDTDDYPDFAFKVAEAVASNEVDLGVLMCGTGIGMSIAANKVKGIRAARCVTKEDAILTRKDNDSNIICLSYKISFDELIDIIDTFINTPFSNEERHIRRVNKISNYEEVENER